VSEYAVAIVGGGIIGRNHAAAIERHPRLRLAAVVDPDPVAGFPVPRYPSLSEAVLDGVDLVAICTPSGLHADDAEVALAAGKHVLVEKPLDASLPRAKRFASLAAQAERRGIVVSVVSQHRFDPASVAVAEAVAQSRLGRLTSAVGSVPWWRTQEYYDSADWRGTWALDGGGAVMNQGVHMVDLLLWLLGTPAEVSAYTDRLTHQGIEVEDVAVAALRFESGALAVLHATTAAYPETGMRLAIHGTAGSAVIHDDQLELFPDEIPPTERYGAPKPADAFVLGHLRQYEDVVAAIDEGRPASVRAQDGLRAVATVRALYLSAEYRRSISFAEVLDG
jgi:predicted dehydrogenase